jgi:hypothetical protein
VIAVILLIPAAATLVALFLVPAVYCILHDFNLLGRLHDESDEEEAKALRPNDIILPSRPDQ